MHISCIAQKPQLYVKHAYMSENMQKHKHVLAEGIINIHFVHMFHEYPEAHTGKQTVLACDVIALHILLPVLKWCWRHRGTDEIPQEAYTMFHYTLHMECISLTVCIPGNCAPWTCTHTHVQLLSLKNCDDVHTPDKYLLPFLFPHFWYTSWFKKTGSHTLYPV